MADRPRLKTPFDEPAPDPPAEQKDSRPTPQTARVRFGVGALFGAMFIVAFAAAAYGGVVKAGDWHEFYVIFALVTPLFALALASLLHRFKRRRPQRRTPPEKGPWD